MLKNERQYHIAKAQAAKFEESLKAFETESRKDRKTHAPRFPQMRFVPQIFPESVARP